MLARFMVNGQPDWDLFQNAVKEAMQGLQPWAEHAGLRAYGEMVGILWNARQFAAAVRLEQFWNKLLSQSRFSLYCAYAIDVFGKEFQISALDSLLCAHTHVVPAETDGRLEASLNTAMEEVLGPKTGGLRVLIKANYRPSWAVLPAGEGIALWLRNNLPEQADRILSRARQLYETPRVEMGCAQ
jgi:MEDS: MEthanogen/methylotroph, DcmR Sensory domain